MEESFSDPEAVYHNVVETLNQTFGQVVNRDVICVVLEACNGDMDKAANAIMNMTGDKEEQPSSSNMENNLEVHHHTLAQTTQSYDDNNINETNSSQNVTVRGSQNRNPFGWDLDIEQSNEPKSKCNPIESQISCESGNMAQTSVSYSRAAKSAARPSRYSNNQINAVPRSDLNFWTSQIKQILMHHNKGSRILIIMRGVPGSGKTYLAKKIVEATVGGHEIDFSTHIYSADDYFLKNGFYRYDKMKLADAHIWNRTKARSAMERGVSPVIIDNTNVESWEMEPYIREGVNNGYLMEIVEPSTPWAKKANQLSRKNIHNVPLHTIKRMLDNFQNGITIENMMSCFNLSYPDNLIPPVLRNFPVMPTIQLLPVDNSNPVDNAVSSVQHSGHGCLPTHENIQNEDKIPNPSGSSSSDEQMQNVTGNNGQFLNSNDAKNKQYQFDKNLEQHVESDIQIKEFEQIDNAWETNEKWEDDPAKDKRTCDENDTTCENKSSENSKPPRKKLNKFKRSSEDTKPDVEKLLGKCQDWTKIDMFIKPWDDTCKSDEEKPIIAVEKVSNGTSMDLGDTDICNVNKACKVMIAIPRDINFYYIPFDKEKIPEKRMLDKSSMINEETLAEVFKDVDNKKQFTLFRNMFKHIPKSGLKNIYDVCHGDVQWAASLVLEGVANAEFPREKSEDPSDSEEENSCADNNTSKQIDDNVNKNAYDECKPSTSANASRILEEKRNNLIPFDNSQPSKSVKPDQLTENSIENVIIPPRKGKKANTSEYHINVKRQIEKNVVISENHYSKHCLKIRNQRQGIQSTVTGNESEKQYVPSNGQSPDDELPSTSNGIIAIKPNYNIDFDTGNDSDDGENNFGPPEKTVNINLNWDVINLLDERNGGKITNYYDMKPVINVPESFLNELNAFWVESCVNQMQAKSKETKLMIQQDEAIAREFEKKEFELYEASEPEIPDLKELMDTELVQAMQNNFNSEWHNNGSMDLATKLTLEKLSNLFPDMHPQALSETLIAHNNNFNNTVEGLLLSTGQAEILDRENGLRDFIMAKGTERREKLRKEREKELSKSESLFLAGDKVDMKLVTRFRNEADLHLTRRNQIYQKLRDNMSRGDPRVAGYYSEIAALHTQQYEHANSLAVAALIQVGSSKNKYVATMDLHHLRVKEAMEGLDLFLDSNINKLREIQKDTLTSKVKYMTLYFITGRGLHSRGGPRIKPAVQKRLAQRGVFFKERNPGLLMGKVYAAHSMTHEVA